MIKRHLAGLVVAAVVAGGGAAAMAAPDGGSAPNPAAPGAARARNQAKPRPDGPLMGRVVHGDLIVRGKDGTFENATVDKGILEAKGDKNLTVKRADGKTVTIKVDDATKYRGVAGFDALQTGKAAVVLSHDGVARMVGQRAPGGNNADGSNVAN
jgi:hypothetical protein